MIDNQTAEKLTAVENLLAYPASMDHDCGREDDECNIDKPECSEMQVKVALRAVQELLDPPHVGLQPVRWTNPSERVFAERWQAANVRRGAINRGYTCLEWILCPTGDVTPPGRPSLRDAQVAASVVQWFGTNVGSEFVAGCVSAARKARDEQACLERSVWQRYVNSTKPQPDDQTTETAKLLAAPLAAVNTALFTHAVGRIATALADAHEAGRAAARKEMADLLAGVKP